MFHADRNMQQSVTLKVVLEGVLRLFLTSLRKHPTHVALASFPSGDRVWLQNSSEAHLAPPPTLPAAAQHSRSAAKGFLIQSSAKRVTRLRCVLSWSEVICIYEKLVRSSWKEAMLYNNFQTLKSSDNVIEWIELLIC